MKKKLAFGGLLFLLSFNNSFLSNNFSMGFDKSIFPQEITQSEKRNIVLLNRREIYKNQLMLASFDLTRGLTSRVMARLEFILNEKNELKFLENSGDERGLSEVKSSFNQVADKYNEDNYFKSSLVDFAVNLYEKEKEELSKNILKKVFSYYDKKEGSSSFRYQFWIEYNLCLNEYSVKEANEIMGKKYGNQILGKKYNYFSKRFDDYRIFSLLYFIDSKVKEVKEEDPLMKKLASSSE